jgi:F0F1-type ATP synthase delta subunit
VIGTRKNLTRATVAGSSVALFAGLAVPAYACTPPQTADLKPVSDTAHPATLSVAAMKAMVDSFVTRRVAALGAESAKVAASAHLTATQKAAIQARIAAQVAALKALRTKVGAETTVAAIKADLAAARLAALKAHVEARIDTRITALTAMVGKIKASARLSDAQKATLVAGVQARIDAMTALRAAVAADTTAKDVLVDLRKAEALWLVKDRIGRHAHKGDPRNHTKVEGAVWWKHGQRAHDPNGVRVVLAGRGDASSCAGHHGWHHHGGGSRFA